jgi:hypothetical protein
MASDPPNLRMTKIRIFWLVYVQEKGLSLRLGRSSTIHDGDITIPVPSIESRPEIGYFGQLDKMKELAYLQGKIYDQLYSSAALAQPQNVRTTRARGLASELEVHTNRMLPSDVCMRKTRLPLLRGASRYSWRYLADKSTEALPRCDAPGY